MQKCAFRLDDITPDMNWDNFEALKKVFDKYHIAPLLGVVPDNQDAHLHVGASREDFWELMQNLQQTGWSILQHGYRHVYETKEAGVLGIHPFSEFAGLPYEVQYEKIKKGKDILSGHGLCTDIFMAPGHTYDQNTLKALKENGFYFVTDGYSEVAYCWNGLTFIPSRMPGPGKIKGIDTICLHLNGMSQSQIRQLDEFIGQNQKVLCSYSELMELQPVQSRNLCIALQEKKNLWIRQLKNCAANSKALQKYLQKSNAGSKWIKLCKRIVMLPLVLYYLFADKN